MSNDTWIALEEDVDALDDLVEQAFRDVEADFPDAECGWELDVARSTLAIAIADGASRRAAREVMRRKFGLVF